MKQKILLVVDVQNEFCHPDGFFAKNMCECNPDGFFGEDKLTAQSIDKVVGNIESSISHFRKEGSPIVYVKAVSDPQYLSESRFERYKKMYAQGFLKDRTWSTEFYRVFPREGELVFKKGAYNPFQNPDFKEHMLRTASDLVLTGFFSDVCIDAVARTADEKDVGIPTGIIADCSIGLFRPHEGNLRFMEMFYGTKIHRTLSDYILNNNQNGGKMTEEYNLQRKFYDRLIEYISQGDVELETEAREKALRFDFSINDLEKALEEGKGQAYRGYSAYARVLLHIARGDLELKNSGRRLAEVYGLNPTDLDLALKVGKSSTK